MVKRLRLQCCVSQSLTTAGFCRISKTQVCSLLLLNISTDLLATVIKPTCAWWKQKPIIPTNPKNVVRFLWSKELTDKHGQSRKLPVLLSPNNGRTHTAHIKESQKKVLSSYQLVFLFGSQKRSHTSLWPLFYLHYPNFSFFPSIPTPKVFLELTPRC